MSTHIIIPPKMEAATATVTAMAMGEARSLREIKRAFIDGRRANNRQFLSLLARVPKASSQGMVRELSADHESVCSLNGLGILLVDDLTIDEYHRARRYGATVFPNLTFNLVKPVQAKSTSLIPTWHLDKINVAAARAKNLTGKGVRVGILDTGIDASHPEFAGKDIQFMEFDDSGRQVASAAHDSDEHGTHVSGLVAGKNVGVAPDASLAVALVLPEGSGTGAQILGGINWLIETDFGDEDVRLMSASLGSGGFDNFWYSTLRNAFQAPGDLMVAAIGNSGELGVDHHGSPGDYDIVEGIGATDENDAVASFSDWGTSGMATKPDFCAPGVDVVSSVPGGYASMSGTSMATPIVSGAAALLLEDDPCLAGNPSALRMALERLLVPLPDVRAGKGRLDLTNI